MWVRVRICVSLEVVMFLSPLRVYMHICVLCMAARFKWLAIKEEP